MVGNMKYKIIYMIFAMALVACHSGFEKAVTPNLDVMTEREDYFTDEAVVFNIESDADFISFYSGEEGNAYEYAQKERIYEGNLSLSFSTAFASGAQWKRQLEEDVTKRILRVFWSSDFTGEYNAEAIAAATWNEMTALAQFPTSRSENAKLLSNTTPSGEIDITSIAAEGKPVYFAFRYHIETYNEELANSRSRASVFNFLINSKASEVNASSDVVTQAKMGWQLVMSGFDYSEKKPEDLSSYLWFDCDTGNPVDLECWAISAPVSLDNKVNIGCDYAVGIKKFVDEPLKTYTYTYSKPGTYDVCFVAANVDHNGVRKETVKKLQILVTDYGGAEIQQPDNNGEWN